MKTLIWSVAWGDYSYMLQSLVKSIRDVGIDHDILVYSDKPIVGCKRLEMMKDIHLDQTQYWKFEYLKQVARLDYDIFVFIDSDHYFVSKPRIDFSEIIGSDLWHSFLESPINSQETTRSDWWNIKNEEMAKIFSTTYNMRIIGLRFFTVFGEWGRPDMVVYKLFNSIFKKF